MNAPQDALQPLGSGPIECDVVVRLDDAVALHLEVFKASPLRSGRLRREILSVVLTPVFLFAALVFFNFIDSDPNKPSLRDLFHFLLFGHVGYLLAALAITACVILIGRLGYRPRMRRILRKLTMQRADVDVSDPALPYAAHVIFSDEGVESQTEPHSIRLNWSRLTRSLEKDGRLFLLGNSMQAMCIPTADIPAHVLTQIRQLVASHIGQADPYTRPARQAQ